MTTIVIEDRQYEVESLAPEARQQILNIRAVDQEMARLNTQMAIAQTARLAYSNALKALLPQGDPKKEPSPLERAMAAGEYLNLG